MEVKLSFELPDERYDFDCAMKGRDLNMAITDMDNFLRNKLKYHDLSKVEEDIYQECRDKLSELTNHLIVEG